MTEILTKLVVDLSKPVGHPERVQSIPLTAEELDERDAMAIQAEEQRVIEEQAAQDKADAIASAESKLQALGLTIDEIKALGF